MMGKAWRGVVLGVMVVAVTSVSASRVTAQVFQVARTFALTGNTGDAVPLLALADVASPTGGPDGIPDIINAAQDKNAVVLAGRGDGTFTATAPTSLGRLPTALAVGKLDGDDVPDLLIGESGNTVEVFLGNEAGPPFEPFGELIAIGRNPVAIALADLNKDGELDAFVVSEASQSSGLLTILLGNGDGTFRSPPAAATSTLSIGLGPSAIVVRDFNGDNNLDAAITNALSSDVSIIRSDSMGHLSLRQTIPVLTAGNAKVEPVAIDAGDLNEDGRLDLVVVNRNADQVVVLDNLPNRDFGTARGFPSGAIGSTPTGVVLSDIDLDDHLDAVVPNNRSSDVSILLGDGDGNFATPRAFVADEETLAVVVGDFNDDDLPDIAASSKGGDSPTAAVLLNEGGGGMRAIEDLPSDPTPIDSLAGDFNNDGLADVALVHGTGRVLIYYSIGTSGFEAPIALALGGNPVAAAAADFNDDGLLDVATANKNTGNILVALQLPAGGFGTPKNIPIGSGIASLTVGDFNRDRRQDLAISRQLEASDGTIDVLLSLGNGNFGSPRSFSVGQTPISSEIGDFNEDGIIDLVVANNVSNDISLLLGNGNGTFQASRFLSASGSPRDLAVADFDRDGCEDFAVTLPVARNSGVFYGNCAGTFARGQQSLSSAESPAAVVARDFTGDGIPDAVTSDQVDNSISTFTKRAGDRFFTRSSSDTYVVSRRPIALASGDFDGDGRYDVLSANSFVAGSGSVLTNIKAPGLLRGDGNADQRVSAADLVAVVAESGDADGNRVEEIAAQFTTTGGVDANGDGVITVQDARAVAARIFPRM